MAHFIMNVTKLSLSLTVIIAIAFGGYSFYEIKSRQAALNADIEGLDDYELCQYTYEKFGIEGVEKIGCTDIKYNKLGIVF